MNIIQTLLESISEIKSTILKNLKKLAVCLLKKANAWWLMHREEIIKTIDRQRKPWI